jgi:O-antigen ligase
MPWLLAGYVWLYLHRPFEYWTFLGTLQIERLYMIFTIIVWMVTPGKRLPSNRLHLAFLYFTIALFTCWVVSPYPQELGEQIWEDHCKVAVFYVLVLTSIHDEAGLRRMLTAYFVALFLYQSHSLLEFICGRYEFRQGTVRMKGVDTTFGDPNTFTATILHAMPFLLPFWFVPKKKNERTAIVGYVLLGLLCILLSRSRRAFLGILFMAVVLMVRSKRRWSLLLLAMLFSPVGFFFLPDTIRDRILTLVDSSYGSQIAIDSRDSRLKFFLIGMDLFNQHPITGVGPAAFALAAGTGLQSHNLYAQTAAEMGFLGVSALVFIVFCFWRNSREMARLYRQHPWWEQDFVYHVGRSAWLAIVLLLFMGAGGHNLYRYNWLWFGAFQIMALQVARRRAADPVAALAGSEPWAPPQAVYAA